MTTEGLRPIRCHSCGKLICEADGTVVFRCPRCKRTCICTADLEARLLPDHLGIVAVGESDHVELGQLFVRHMGESECRVVR